MLLTISNCACTCIDPKWVCSHMLSILLVIYMYSPEREWCRSGGVGGGRSRKRWTQRTKMEERSLDIMPSTSSWGPSENTCYSEWKREGVGGGGCVGRGKTGKSSFQNTCINTINTRVLTHAYTIVPWQAWLTLNRD